eukprot:6140603-Pleurochrysis_carterae.AAC.2
MFYTTGVPSADLDRRFSLGCTGLSCSEHSSSCEWLAFESDCFVLHLHGSLLPAACMRRNCLHMHDLPGKNALPWGLSIEDMVCGSVSCDAQWHLIQVHCTA